MSLDFTRSLVTTVGEYDVVYNGVSTDGLWHTLSYFDPNGGGGGGSNEITYYGGEEAITFYPEPGDTGGDSSDTVAGWNTVQVNEDGILRSDIEGGTVDPTPFVEYKVTYKDLVVAVYPDGSTVSTHYNPDSLPTGDIGRIQISYGFDGEVVVEATVEGLLPLRS